MKKYELVQMAEKNPKLGARKLAEYFNIGKKQACTILKSKMFILESYESIASNEVHHSLKRSHASGLSMIGCMIGTTWQFLRTSTLMIHSCVRKQKRLHSTWKFQGIQWVARKMENEAQHSAVDH